MKRSLSIVIGTRPELIKMAPVMWELKKRSIPFYFIHSNQHYSKELDEQISGNLDIPRPTYHLHVGSGSHAMQTGKVMEGTEKIFGRIHPRLVLVHGDTNTTLGAALAATKMHIPVAHVEAGLRSFDYGMPEEINRMLVDHISRILFAPTGMARKNLIHEGIDKKNIFVTGNTIVDVIGWYKRKPPMHSIGSQITEKFALITVHRPENVDDKKQLVALIKLLTSFSKVSGLQFIWPIHPRTKKNLKDFGLSLVGLHVTILPPVNYFQMIQYIEQAAIVLTDSGGIQEEAYILKKPLITLRTSTERPETLPANRIVGLDQDKAVAAWNAFRHGFGRWGNELGDGHAAIRIVDTLEDYL